MKRPETKIKPFILINTKTGKEYPFNKVMDCVTFLWNMGHNRAARSTVYSLIRGNTRSCSGYVIKTPQQLDDALPDYIYRENIFEAIDKIEKQLKSLKLLIKPIKLSDIKK